MEKLVIGYLVLFKMFEVYQYGSLRSLLKLITLKIKLNQIEQLKSLDETTDYENILLHLPVINEDNHKNLIMPISKNKQFIYNAPVQNWLSKQLRSLNLLRGFKYEK